MNAVLQILKNQRLWPLWVAIGFTIILLPSLGSYGFWEPQEMGIAARALPPSEAEVAEQTRLENVAKKREADRIARIEKIAKDKGQDPTTSNTKSNVPAPKDFSKKKSHEPPLRDWLVEKGISSFGVSEFGARLPFFLLALLTGLGTYFLGLRIRGPEAGLLSVAILVACPLFIFQSRQLTSEMGAMAGGVFLLLGTIGLASPRKKRKRTSGQESATGVISSFLFSLIGQGMSLRIVRAIWNGPINVFLLFIGAALGYYSSGFLIGVLAPLSAIAVALSVSALSDLPPKSDDSDASTSADTKSEKAVRRRLQIAAGIALLAFFGSLAYFVLEVFDWVEAKDGEFSIVGKTFHASGDCTEPGTRLTAAAQKCQKLLGGKWALEGNLKFNFNSLFEQVAFGMFPWVCLAPVAIFRMAQGGSRGTNPLGARMLFAWAAITWVLCTIALRKIGPVQYAAVPALAAAMGIWIDELWTARKKSHEAGQRDSINLAPPLIALFVLLAAVVIAKDIKSFPAIFLGLHLDKAIAKFPGDVSIHKIVMALGMLFAFLLASGIYGWYLRATKPAWRNYELKVTGPESIWRSVWRGMQELGIFLAYNIPTAAHRVFAFLGRWGIPAAIVVGLMLSLFLAQVWTPRLSTKLSSKATFEVFHNLRQEGNILGVVGKASPGASFYAEGEFESLPGRPQLIKFLQKPERVFALVRASELCPIHKEAAKGRFNYYVVDDSNADKVMLSNRMWNDPVSPPEKLDGLMRSYLDQNPLARDIVRKKPEGIQHPASANFDDKLELIGIDVPSEIDRGQSFEARLYYKVLKPIRRNWQVFVHFDGGGVRFQADHFPVNKRCGTNYWQPGDYIIDRFTVEPGGVEKSNTVYQVWTGLFVGSSGNWENMKAKSGKPDDNNRVPVATIRVR